MRLDKIWLAEFEGLWAEANDLWEGNQHAPAFHGYVAANTEAFTNRQFGFGDALVLNYDAREGIELVRFCARCGQLERFTD